MLLSEKVKSSFKSMHPRILTADKLVVNILDFKIYLNVARCLINNTKIFAKFKAHNRRMFIVDRGLIPSFVNSILFLVLLA